MRNELTQVFMNLQEIEVKGKNLIILAKCITDLGIIIEKCPEDTATIPAQAEISKTNEEEEKL